eukprot:COSAG06_NODE_42922_length_377_cov_0.697842_1_plen_51_part_01
MQEKCLVLSSWVLLLSCLVLSVVVVVVVVVVEVQGCGARRDAPSALRLILR